jgi:hypothetical protein
MIFTQKQHVIKTPPVKWYFECAAHVDGMFADLLLLALIAVNRWLSCSSLNESATSLGMVG